MVHRVPTELAGQFFFIFSIFPISCRGSILVGGQLRGHENMTEAELIESMTEYFGLNAEMLSIYLTVTSGYLIVAYLVGGKLTRSQLVIISGLYIMFAAATTYLAIGYGMRGILTWSSISLQPS